MDIKLDFFKKNDRMNEKEQIKKENPEFFMNMPGPTSFKSDYTTLMFNGKKLIGYVDIVMRK
jgi:hypothetical protein